MLSIFNVLIFFEKINNICQPFISSGMVKQRFIFIPPEHSFSNDEIQSVISFDPETREDQRDNFEHLNRACTCLPREEPRMSNAIVVSSCLTLIIKGRTLIFVPRTCSYSCCSQLADNSNHTHAKICCTKTVCGYSFIITMDK